MEMIEEAMLAEATMTRSDLLKRGNDSKLRTMIKDGNKIQLKDGSSLQWTSNPLTNGLTTPLLRTECSVIPTPKNLPGTMFPLTSRNMPV